jgi:hypothetical protein
MCAGVSRDLTPPVWSAGLCVSGYCTPFWCSVLFYTGYRAPCVKSWPLYPGVWRAPGPWYPGVRRPRWGMMSWWLSSGSSSANFIGPNLSVENFASIFHFYISVKFPRTNLYFSILFYSGLWRGIKVASNLIETVWINCSSAINLYEKIVILNDT